MIVNIGWPEFILLSLHAAALVMVAVNHGKPRGDYHAGHSFVAVVIAILLLA